MPEQPESKMTILMLTWEFYPLIVGGLGLACYELCRALLKRDVEILLVLPTSQNLWFRLVHPRDADVLPPVFVDPDEKKAFEAAHYSTPAERLILLGLSLHPGLYDGKIGKLREETGNSESGDSGGYESLVEFLAGRERFDVIHAHDWMTFPAAFKARKLSGSPVICHMHSTEYDRAGGPGNSQIHDIEARGLADADRIVAVSEYTSDQIHIQYGINQDKIAVVHNACRISSGRRRRRVFKEPVVVFAGRLTFQKGPEDFVEATRWVMREFPSARFVITGTGDLEHELMITSAAWRTGTRILFAGFLERDALENLLRAADIVAVPSRSEPFGLIVLEAMRLGAAVIVTKTAGVAEVVRNVVKVESGDPAVLSRSILMLLQNSKKRRELARKGSREAAKIHWDVPARKVREIYRSVAW